MTAEDLQPLILDALREVQEMSGREWNELQVDAKPIGDLDGFDSLAGVETTVMIEVKLGCTLELDSIFVSDDGKRALTVKEISKRVANLLKTWRGEA